RRDCCARFGQYEAQSGDPDQDRDHRSHALSARSGHRAASSLWGDRFQPWGRSGSRAAIQSRRGMRGVLGRNRLAHAPPALLRMRGSRAQDGVILAKDPIILLSVVLMALVARGGSVLGHLRLERVLVAEAEVGPVAGLVLEALRVLDRGLQAGELALEVAVAAGRLLGPDAAEFLDQDGAVSVL